MNEPDDKEKAGKEHPGKKGERKGVEERRSGGGYNYTREHDDWAGNEPERRDESGREYDRDRADVSPDDFEDFDDIDEEVEDKE